MGMLTARGRQKYSLAFGTPMVAICDEKNCGRLIPVGELYTVKKWKARIDGLTFLGAVPSKIRCKKCQDELHPIPKLTKASSNAKLSKPIKNAIIALYAKFPKTILDTKTLVAKLRRKKKLSKLKRTEFTKVLKALRKDKLLQYKDKVWRAQK